MVTGQREPSIAPAQNAFCRLRTKVIGWSEVASVLDWLYRASFPLCCSPDARQLPGERRVQLKNLAHLRFAAVLRLVCCLAAVRGKEALIQQPPELAFQGEARKKALRKVARSSTSHPTTLAFSPTSRKLFLRHKRHVTYSHTFSTAFGSIHAT